MKKILDDNSLIKRVIKNDDSALKELVSRHEKLYFSMARYQLNSSLFDFDGEKYHFFYKIAKDYDASRGMKFSSYLAQRTKFLCKSLKVKTRELTPLEAVEHRTEEKNDNLDGLLEIWRNKIESLEDKRGRKVLLCRYFNGDGVMTFAKIAKKLKIPSRTVKHIHDKHINRFRKLSNICQAL